MEDVKALVLDLSGPVSSIKELKQQIETLSVSLAKAGETSAGYQEGLNLLEKRQKELADATSLMKAQNTAAKDSYYSLNKQLTETRKAYKNLSAEERANVDVGGKMMAQIKGLDLELKSLDAEMGQFQRNVGDYSQSINKMSKNLHAASDSFKAAAAGGTIYGKAMDTADKISKIFSANPLIGTLAVIMALVTPLIKKIKENNTAMEATNRVMASMSPIMDLVSIVIEKLATLFAKLADKVAGLLTKILPKKADAVPAAMEETAEATEKAASATDKMTEKVDALTESLKKLREEIAEDMAIRKEDEQFQKEVDERYFESQKKKEEAEKKKKEREALDLKIRKKQREEDEAADAALAKQQEEREKKTLERRKALNESYYTSLVSIMGSIADIYESNSKIDKESARKSKALRIATATIETISGAVSAYMNTIKSIVNPAVAIPAGIANAAAVSAAGLANIAKIRTTDVSGSGSASVSVPAMSSQVSAPVIQPTIPQTAILTSSSQEQSLNRPVEAYIVSDKLEADRKSRDRQESETSW